MKSLALSIFLTSFFYVCNGQYYYNDIVAEGWSQKQYMALKNNDIHQVSATSYESDNQPTKDFYLHQDIGENAATVTINTSFPSSGTTLTVNRYKDNRIQETKDSSTNIVTHVIYTYSNAGKISSIQTVTDDTFMKSHSEEMHLWYYTGNRPDSMLKIENNIDTTIIKFKFDEKGNAIEEDWVKRGKNIESYYYYYNTRNELTDIVRFNDRAQKLLPDYLFNYDNSGRVDQMTEVPPGNSDYMTWKYLYSANGLKQSEILFNKEKQLVGRIEYQYQ